MNIPEAVRQLVGPITAADVIICLPGLTLFAVWLYKTSMGRNALADSPPRRNSMPAYLPFIPLFIWVGLIAAATFIKEMLLPDLPDWQNVYLDNLIICVGAILATAAIILLARAHFVRRLKGFGLSTKTIRKDFFAATLNLISVYPLVAGALILTIFVGKLVWGPGFEMQRHQELELITLHSQLEVRLLIIVSAIVVMPVFEEMLFRGLFQTVIRSFLNPTAEKAWLSIVISSALFAAVHANAGHWPALFVLAVGMGYAYEKSGSLLRPIFIHSLFNAVSIIFALRNG
jgi:membrane protease YdiL (CAAX protease family)